MTRGYVRRQASLTVGKRLFLGLLPALLAVVLAVGLAYYGEYGRTAPEVFVLGASILAVLSLIVTWINTRYLSARISRLTGAVAHSAEEERNGADEFDRIERAVGNLGSALSASEAERARINAASAARLREEATMLAAVARDAITQLDEVRLPLHILLDSPFGALNENQEELLRDARNGADAMAAALRRLAQIADADRDALPVQRTLVQVNDVVRSVTPLARAAADRRGARVEVSLEPGLPRVMADRARLAESLALIVNEAVACVNPERPLTVRTVKSEDGRRVEILVAPCPEAASSAATADAPAQDGDDRDPTARALARRFVLAQGGSLDVGPGGIIVRLSMG